jgi:hypothetical protein
VPYFYVVRYCYVIILHFSVINFSTSTGKNLNNAFPVTDCLLGPVHTHQRLENEKNEEKHVTTNRHGKIPGAGWKLKFKLQKFNSPR